MEIGQWLTVKLFGNFKQQNRAKIKNLKTTMKLWTNIKDQNRFLAHLDFYVIKYCIMIEKFRINIIQFIFPILKLTRGTYKSDVDCCRQWLTDEGLMLMVIAEC